MIFNCLKPFKKLVILCVVLFIVACNNHDEYTFVSDNAKYKLLSFSTQSNHIEEGDLVEF